MTLTLSNADFDRLVLVANPNSTRRGDLTAHRLRRLLVRHFKADFIEIMPTQERRHATELARSSCEGARRPLIIAVGGDGSFNEVVNGVMEAMVLDPRLRPVVAVFRAGNANDHYRGLRGHTSLHDFKELILARQTSRLDLLELRTTLPSGELLSQFAHSYIGFGLTAEAALTLDRRSYGRIGEIFLVPPRTFRMHQPFWVDQGGERRLVNSLSFHKSKHMAKYLRFPQARPDDGQFLALEISLRRQFFVRSRIIKQAVGGSLLRGGFTNLPSYSSYSFLLPEGGLAQLDGEYVDILPRGSSVSVIAHHHAMETLAFTPD